MDGLKLLSVLLVLYTGALGAFVIASTRVPRMRAWYLQHYRAFALLLLPALVVLFVVIGVEITR
jgi:hypothetical protein